MAKKPSKRLQKESQIVQKDALVLWKGYATGERLQLLM